MKRIFFIIFIFIHILCCCTEQGKENNKEITLSNNNIYFFYYNQCPYCHDAINYINSQYPDLKLTMINIHTPEGYKLLVKCAKKYNLYPNIGTPLFAIGDHYIMGWSDSNAKKLDKYIKPFLK